MELYKLTVPIQCGICGNSYPSDTKHSCIPNILYQEKYVNSNKYLIEKELTELDWETKRTARHEYFMAKTERDYTYGKGFEETYKSKPFSKLVNQLMERLNDELKSDFNVCFLNKYDDEKQHLGWHADDFVGMKKEQPIAVVSFGAEREIWIKPKEYKGDIPKNWRYLLHSGSLFLMPIGMQETHFHKIPKHNKPCGWRISLTFRSFY